MQKVRVIQSDNTTLDVVCRDSTVAKSFMRHIAPFVVQVVDHGTFIRLHMADRRLLAEGENYNNLVLCPLQDRVEVYNTLPIGHFYGGHADGAEIDLSLMPVSAELN